MAGVGWSPQAGALGAVLTAAATKMCQPKAQQCCPSPSSCSCPDLGPPLHHTPQLDGRTSQPHRALQAPRTLKPPTRSFAAMRLLLSMSRAFSSSTSVTWRERAWGRGNRAGGVTHPACISRSLATCRQLLSRMCAQIRIGRRAHPPTHPPARPSAHTPAPAHAKISC